MCEGTGQLQVQLLIRVEVFSARSDANLDVIPDSIPVTRTEIGRDKQLS